VEGGQGKEEGSKGSKGNEQREWEKQEECAMYIQSVFMYVTNV
jgi:hypothetical protein